MKAESCFVCRSAVGLRRFVIAVDGEELRLAPTLCADHGDLYLLAVGKVLGGLVHAIPVPEPAAGQRVAAALERALSRAPEATTHTADAVIVYDVLRRWYGDGAKHVLRAALELAEVDS